MKLYKENSKQYPLPIFDSDDAIPSYTWRELIDIYVANHGHKVTDKDFRNHMDEIVREIKKQMLDEYSLVKGTVLTEIERSE